MYTKSGLPGVSGKAFFFPKLIKARTPVICCTASEYNGHSHQTLSCKGKKPRVKQIVALE
jgi:hypothetical protein